MTANPAPIAFRERLVPGPMLFVALLLLIPGVALIVTPISAAIAFPISIVVYVLAAGSFLLMSPVLEVSGGRFTAGRAGIPIELLGRIDVLDADRLRAVIGPGADARAYLMLRGYIHSGLRIEVRDPADPAPYWVVTTRKPETLRAAIETARGG